MSIVQCQPSPFGYLQREKHIDHHAKGPKEKKQCRCMEVSHTQASNQKDENRRHSYRTKANSLENGIIETEKCSDPKSVRSSRKGVAPVTYVSSSSSHSRSTDRELRVQRSLTIVEELDESVCSGLQILASAQQFCITSKAKPQGWSCQSKRLYIISSRTAKQLLVATEDSSCLCYQLCGPARSSCLRLFDQSREEILRFCRPYRVDVCCLFCCLMVIRVFSSSNALLGFVQQRWSLFSPSLSVYDSEGRRRMDIRGPWSAARCHSDQEFQVTSVEGQKIAIIWKRWPGFNEEYNMDHDFFGLDISASISPTDKALLLSATFLLNFMFFEMS
ncbi:phospholipid scramblase family member 5-like isoform X2 [Ranitomeya variabilis]|uniref:phospholipid scramblase family member 5-like isoform X2 n=1 Tax=Ranitomeya variabilis TaxID=490064 RepID=UPI004056AC5A